MEKETGSMLFESIDLPLRQRKICTNFVATLERYHTRRVSRRRIMKRHFFRMHNTRDVRCGNICNSCNLHRRYSREYPFDRINSRRGKTFPTFWHSVRHGDRQTADPMAGCSVTEVIIRWKETENNGMGGNTELRRAIFLSILLRSISSCTLCGAYFEFLYSYVAVTCSYMYNNAFDFF